MVRWTRPAAPSRPPLSSRAPLFSGPVLGRGSGNDPAVWMDFSDFSARRPGKTSLSRDAGRGAPDADSGDAGRSSVDLHVCGVEGDTDSLHSFLHPKRTAPSRIGAGVECVSGSQKKRFA